MGGLVFLVAFVCGVVCAVIAGGRHRNPVGWFVIGALFPLLGVILVLVLPSNSTFELGTADILPEPGPYSDLLAQQVAVRAQRQSGTFDALDKLVELKDRGMLSPQEFDEKKAELISRL